jgi:hypothetical protein
MGIKIDSEKTSDRLFEREPRFYNQFGEAITYMNGKKITIRDCKKYGLYPSVSEILNIIYPKWGIQEYQINRLLTAAYIIYKEKRDSDEISKREFINTIYRIKEHNSFRIKNIGNHIHEILAKYFRRKIDENINSRVLIDLRNFSHDIFNNLLPRKHNFGKFEVEKSVKPNLLGYGGTPDFFYGYIFDWKIKVLGNLDRVYERNCLQVAAYNLYKKILLGGNDDERLKRCYIININGKDFPKYKVHCIEKEQLSYYMFYFYKLYELWCVKNKYQPKSVVKVRRDKNGLFYERDGQKYHIS